MDKPNIVEIINNSKDPIPQQAMEVIKAMRLKIEEMYPGRKFKFILDKIEDDKWDVKVQFERPINPSEPKTKG